MSNRLGSYSIIHWNIHLQLVLQRKRYHTSYDHIEFLSSTHLALDVISLRSRAGLSMLMSQPKTKYDMTDLAYIHVISLLLAIISTPDHSKVSTSKWHSIDGTSLGYKL